MMRILIACLIAFLTLIIAPIVVYEYQAHRKLLKIDITPSITYASEFSIEIRNASEEAVEDACIRVESALPIDQESVRGICVDTQQPLPAPTFPDRNTLVFEGNPQNPIHLRSHETIRIRWTFEHTGRSPPAPRVTIRGKKKGYADTEAQHRNRRIAYGISVVGVIGLCLLVLYWKGKPMVDMKMAQREFERDWSQARQEGRRFEGFLLQKCFEGKGNRYARHRFNRLYLSIAREAIQCVRVGRDGFQIVPEGTSDEHDIELETHFMKLLTIRLKVLYDTQQERLNTAPLASLIHQMTNDELCELLKNNQTQFHRSDLKEN